MTNCWLLLLTFCLVLFEMVHEAEGGGHVTIVFKRFRNPTSRKFNGHCCDLKLWGRCGKCDTYFKICVTDVPNPRSMRHCALGYTRTVRLGRDDFHMRLRISRPFTALKGHIGIYVEAWDRDTFTPDDLVDKLTLTLPVRRPDPNNHVTTVYLRSMRGRRATLSAEINVYCDSGFYGTACTTHCHPRDDRYGHYTCNLHGHKVCRRNYYGARCNLYCVEYNDDYHGHFKCDHQGRKSCRSGWYGPDCLRYCMESSNNVQGHFTCDSRGTKVCRSGWHGEDCMQYCVPSEDDFKGHYTCDKNGKKICRAGWYAETDRTLRATGRPRDSGRGPISARIIAARPSPRPPCTKYCMPKDDDILGHYLCDAAGDRVCTQGWYGEKCTVYCTPHDDNAHGHYTCGSRGQRVCRRGWEVPLCMKCSRGFYPPNCNTSCLPHSSTAEGHYTCDKQGNKVCRMWWYGPTCTNYCVPHDDNTHGHYSCDSMGNKRCHARWHGVNCTMECVTQGGNASTCKCDDTGNPLKCKCNDTSSPNMCKCNDTGSPNICKCNDTSKPNKCKCDDTGNPNKCKCDDTGNPNKCKCDDTGNQTKCNCDVRFCHGNMATNCQQGFAPPKCKECLPGLYGVNCTKSCITEPVHAMSNDTHDAKGVIKARAHDKGMRMGDVSNVVCSDNGDVKCRKWWYGRRCGVYCVPHDDDDNGHYICDINGRKRCILGWLLPKCNVKGYYIERN